MKKGHLLDLWPLQMDLKSPILENGLGFIGSMGLIAFFHVKIKPLALILSQWFLQAIDKEFRSGNWTET